MPSLKFLRNRIASVKSTKKITSAMKMVAASKLRQTQERHASGAAYDLYLRKIGFRMVESVPREELLKRFPIMRETQECNTHLLIVAASDRGLCGGFNGNIVREAKSVLTALRAEGKEVRILCIGRKARDLLKRDYAALIGHTYEDIAKPCVPAGFATELAGDVLRMYHEGEIGACTVIYNRFVNALVQEPTRKTVIPFAAETGDPAFGKSGETAGIYTFEPEIVRLFEAYIPQAVSEKIYTALTDSIAGEHAARMNAMDNATNNAGDMIEKLTVRYNRARQANITKELIEIISAMEAM